MLNRNSKTPKLVFKTAYDVARFLLFCRIKHQDFSEIQHRIFYRSVLSAFFKDNEEKTQEVSDKLLGKLISALFKNPATKRAEQLITNPHNLFPEEMKLSESIFIRIKKCVHKFLFGKQGKTFHSNGAMVDLKAIYNTIKHNDRRVFDIFGALQTERNKEVKDLTTIGKLQIKFREACHDGDALGMQAIYYVDKINRTIKSFLNTCCHTLRVEGQMPEDMGQMIGTVSKKIIELAFVDERKTIFEVVMPDFFEAVKRYKKTLSVNSNLTKMALGSSN